jgi:uncharacterized membrane protein YkvA (DUF1232 family)
MSLFTDLKKSTSSFKVEVVALFLAARDPRTPWYAKVLAGAIAAYAFSPIDLIPDFVPILGYVDDVILIPIGVAFVIKLIPIPVLADCRARANELRGRKKPKRWIAGAVIVAVWVAVAGLCTVWVYKTFIIRT